MVDAQKGMQYSRAMMRTLVALTLVTTLAGCDEKQDAAATTTTVAPPATTTVAPTPTPTTTVVAPSGAVVAPSGATASGEATKPEHAKGEKGGKPAAAATPQPGGVMPHGNPEDGTLRYNPPPAQNPPAKKGTTP